MGYQGRDSAYMSCCPLRRAQIFAEMFACAKVVRLKLSNFRVALIINIPFAILKITENNGTSETDYNLEKISRKVNICVAILFFFFYIRSKTQIINFT